MATVQIRPDGYVSQGSWLGAATNMSDNNDSTTVGIQSATGEMDITLGNAGIPAGSTINSITVTVRGRATAINHVCNYGLRNSSGGDSSRTQYTNGSSFANYATNFGAFTSDIDGMRVVVQRLTGSTQIVYVAEVYVDVDYTVPNYAPTTTVTGPAESATVTTTGTTITWTYSDPEGVAPNTYRALIYNESQYSAGGFNPGASSAVWDSGNVASSATSVAVPTGTFTSNGFHRAYVATYDGVNWSAWDYNQFTVQLPLPPTATVHSPSENDTSVTDQGFFAGWTYASSGAAQTRYNVQVYSFNQYNVAGFTPVRGEGPFVYGSGQQSSSADYHWIPSGTLFTGRTYRVYVWVFDGTQWNTTADYNEFTIRQPTVIGPTRTLKPTRFYVGSPTHSEPQIVFRAGTSMSVKELFISNTTGATSWFSAYHTPLNVVPKLHHAVVYRQAVLPYSTTTIGLSADMISGDNFAIQTSQPSSLTVHISGVRYADAAASTDRWQLGTSTLGTTTRLG